MPQNKKNSIIFVIFVILPILIIIINSHYARPLQWNYNHLNQITSWSLVIAILGCIYIAYRNHKKGAKNRFWAVITITLAIVFILLLFLGNSISNIGF